jgi:hypothetical protein
MIRDRIIVCGYEVVCAKRRSDAHFGSAGDANIQPDIAVTVAILNQMLEPDLHEEWSFCG